MLVREYRALVNRAHVLVRTMQRRGELPRVAACAVCGAAGQMHHDDYRSPEKVRWLCHKHHREEHKNKSQKYQFLGEESNEPKPYNHTAISLHRRRNALEAGH